MRITFSQVTENSCYELAMNKKKSFADVATNIGTKILVKKFTGLRCKNCKQFFNFVAHKLEKLILTKSKSSFADMACTWLT